jgi:hypothetical protein
MIIHISDGRRRAESKDLDRQEDWQAHADAARLADTPGSSWKLALGTTTAVAPTATKLEADPV